MEASSYQPHEVEEPLLEPYQYLLSVPGKDVRGMLIDAFQLWLRVPEEKVQAVKEIVTKLHTASLMIDDVEDNSKLRRGVPVTHTIYGTPSTINTANYVTFLALEDCHRLGSKQAIDAFVSELLSLHKGQGLDILWRDRGRCPTEEEYTDMVIDKTGGLFRLAVRLLQAFSSDGGDYIPLVNNLALYFQIRDDLINLTSSSYHEHKSYCEDFTEGKFSFPIIHSIVSRPSDSRLLNILRQKTEDPEIKRYAVQYMETQTDSFNYTRRKLREVKEKLLAQITALGGNDMLTALINRLAAQVERGVSPAPRSTPIFPPSSSSSHSLGGEEERVDNL